MLMANLTYNISSHFALVDKNFHFHRFTFFISDFFDNTFFDLFLDGSGIIIEVVSKEFPHFIDFFIFVLELVFDFDGEIEKNAVFSWGRFFFICYYIWSGSCKEICYTLDRI